MNSTTPIEIEGKIYDRYTVSLAMMVRHNGDGSNITSVNVSLVPTHITEDGEVLTADAHRRGMVAGDVALASEDVKVAIDKILAAGQEFINGRGL